MCVYSMIVDHYRDKWTPLVPAPVVTPAPPVVVWPPQPIISAEEVAEFKRLLERAREYDRKHNEPHCELEEKKQKIRDLATQLGVDVSFIDE